MPRVAACQCTVADLDADSNVQMVVDRVRGLPDDVTLAVFPEYALTGFVADARARAHAISVDGPALTRLAEVARGESVHLVIGFLERREDTLHNTLAAIDPHGDRTYYRKRHLWADEATQVSPGTERVTVDTPIGRAGLVTCYDLNFVAESAAFTDPPVDALLVAGAWPGAYAANWDLLLRARALDGVRWVVAAGRTGTRDVPGTPPTTYAGRSAIVNPDGTVAGRLDRAPHDLVRDLDPALLDEHRAFIGTVG